MSKKAKTDICNSPHTAVGISIASITVSALQFLPAKKQKHIYTTGLTSCWHSYPRIIIFMSGKAKTNTCGRLDTATDIPATSIVTPTL